MPQDKKVKLHTGKETYTSHVFGVTAALHGLLFQGKKDLRYVYAFVELVKYSRGEIAKIDERHKQFLTSSGLLDADGQVFDYFVDVIAASVKGESFNMKHIDPITGK